MDKLTRRFLFGDLYNMESYEEYFAEMSRTGLHLEKVGSVFAYFKEGEPKQLNYRIDMFKKNEEETKIKLHRDKGWELVGTKEPFLVFSSKENSGLEELYETPEEHWSALKSVVKKSLASKFLGILITIIAVLALILFISMQVKIDRGVYLSMVDGGFLMGIVPIFISLFVYLRQKWHVNRIMRTLKSGEFLIHYGNHFLGKLGFALRKLAFALFIGTLFYQVFVSESSNVFDYEAIKELPIVSVADIEKIEDAYTPDSYDSLYKSWSFFAPKKYELWEYVEIIEDDYVLDVALYANYYLARFPKISEGLVEDLLHREERFKLKFSKILDKDGIVCYGGEEDNRTSIICRKDLEVVLVRYYDGTASLEDIMRAIIKKLENREAETSI